MKKKRFFVQIKYVTRVVVNRSALFLRHSKTVHRRFERCVKSLDLYVTDVTAMIFLQVLPSVGQYQFVFVRLAYTSVRVSAWSGQTELKLGLLM